MTRIDVRDLKGKIKNDAKGVTLRTGDKKQHIRIAYQNTGFGKKGFLYARTVQRMFSTCILMGLI